MAHTVKLKRSATPAKVPLTTDLELGEIAVNTYDGKMYIKKDDGTASVVEIAGDGAFTADVQTQISPTTSIVLDEATGNEAALTINYTVNKATSGNDSGLILNKTDTVSPGTSLLIDAQVASTSVFSVDDAGNASILGDILLGNQTTGVTIKSGGGGGIDFVPTSATGVTDIFFYDNSDVGREGTCEISWNSDDLYFQVYGISDREPNLIFWPEGGICDFNATLTAIGTKNIGDDGTGNFNNLYLDGLISAGGTISGINTNTISKYSADTNAATFQGIKGRGTSGTPAAVTSGDHIVQLTASAYYDASNIASNKAIIFFDASENWSASAQGTSISFETTTPTTTTRVERLVIDESGLTVTGGVSATGSVTASGDMIFAERADHASTPAAGFGYLWVKSDAPTSLIFTDDGGTDYDLTDTYSDPMTTRGDVLYRDSSNITERLPIGEANASLLSDGTDVAWGRPKAYLVIDSPATTQYLAFYDGLSGYLTPTTDAALTYNATSNVLGCGSVDTGVLTYGRAITKTFTAGSVTVPIRGLGVVNSSGTIDNTDANTSSLSVGLLVMATEEVTNAATGEFALWGEVSGFTGLTTGATYFISGTTGGITTTAPSTTGDTVRVVGYALSTTVLFFCPSQTWITVA